MNNQKIQTLANTIRMLAADTVQKANSGHPGMPIGTADIASVLWSSFMNFNPQDPCWINRDRFVLSAGHGSTLLYSLLHLFGYEVSLDDLKNFRQWKSRTPGHPEYGFLPGVECTTGPLGQGVGMATGMAFAAKMAAERFNTAEHTIIDHFIYGIAGDGCMMEGVAAEASSFAGHFKLDNLILFYDSNNITIEGKTDLAFSDDTAKRYEAYGWKTWTIDGHNLDEIAKAIAEAQKLKGAPKLIICRTHIAKGSPTMQDKSASHGSPLGEEEINAFKKSLDFPADKTFYISEEIRAFCNETDINRKKRYNSWVEIFEAWKNENPDKYTEFEKSLKKEIPVELKKELSAEKGEKPEATRVSSGKMIQKIASHISWTAGGSADLEPSVKTHIKNSTSITPDSFAGRNIHFGVREHGMGAISNGISLYGLTLPHCSTFLVFSDYMKGSLRLSALMGIPVIYIFTHDSIFLGEDGPTHQPIEHLGALRIIPNFTVIRPADSLETAGAWLCALENKKGPTALILSRQNLPQLHQSSNENDIEKIKSGGYILVKEDSSKPEFIIMATGSEVHPAAEAGKILKEQGYDNRIVSMPSLEIFDKQDKQYQKEVIPENIPVIAVEASNTHDWDKFIGKDGMFIGIDHFGDSAPAEVLAEKYGFTGNLIAQKIKEHLKLN